MSKLPEPGLKAPQAIADGRTDLADLVELVERSRRVVFLGGAGCSTASGIPDYRDEAGSWKHRKPMQLAEFLSSHPARQRYWARSFVGWSRISGARPNPSHLALAALEAEGRLQCLITQNVDNLHRVAGSRKVIDLHGILQRVRCLDCGAVTDRDAVQQELALLNPDWEHPASSVKPDGDAVLAPVDVGRFRVPSCRACSGILKPDVVFFGEGVPAQTLDRVTGELRKADALLVAGTSLMVFSGFRLVRMVREQGKPVAIVNRGKTRADDIATHRYWGDCGAILAALADYFTGGRNVDARGVDGRL